MNPGESGTTVLGRTAKFRGEFTGSENMVVEGDFEGVIRNPGANVTVGPQARVRAAIAGRDVIVYGKVEGQIHATGSVSLRGLREGRQNRRQERKNGTAQAHSQRAVLLELIAL